MNSTTALPGVGVANQAGQTACAATVIGVLLACDGTGVGGTEVAEGAVVEVAVGPVVDVGVEDAVAVEVAV